ncbi:hypothetical protein L6R52_40670, partial [Myxococcota bacterium]|nr:hypothetical protein [Myxococcota bacterium]
ARAVSTIELVEEGRARVDGHPRLARGTPASDLGVRSAFVLLDQLFMPAEGHVAHDYFVFSREPTWWFARLGEHLHEGLALIPLARVEPERAMGALRIFAERVEDDGYVPYSIGPVVEQTALRTASAPLFAYVASEVAQRTGDAAFAREAYDAGVKMHRFWIEQRDADRDGLSEWGGYGKVESLRDLENVIWENVAAPETVEAVDLAAMLVMDARALAVLAELSGRSDEAARWRDEAEARARRINATMWDEASGFYHHVDRDTERFVTAEGKDLRRQEIAGFLPLWAGVVPADRRARLLTHLQDPERFWRPFGVTSLAVDDAYYSADPSHCCRWNGPIWIPWQFLLMRGLRDGGDDALATELARRSLAAVEAGLVRWHQFRELHHPDDADAPNDSMPNYIWATLAAEMALESGL